MIYSIMAKSEAPTTVRMPLTTIERLLVAPSTEPISMALAVPMAWDALPKAMPLAMGSSMRRSFRNFSAKMLPNTPERMMTTTVTET